MTKYHLYTAVGEMYGDFAAAAVDGEMYGGSATISGWPEQGSSMKRTNVRAFNKALATIVMANLTMLFRAGPESNHKKCDNQYVGAYSTSKTNMM